jgi:hypothetical protein
MGQSTEVTSTPTADPRTGPAIEAGAQAAPGLIQNDFFNQFANQAFAGGLPQQQLFNQVNAPLMEQLGQGTQAGQGLLNLFNQFAQTDTPNIQGVGGGGRVGGPRGTGMITGLAEQFLAQGTQATQPAFDLFAQDAAGRQRQRAGNIGSLAFQQQGIDLESQLGAQRQAQLNSLFQGGGELGLGARGQDVQRAVAAAQVRQQNRRLQQEAQIFNALGPLSQLQGLSGLLGPLLGAGQGAAGNLINAGAQAGAPIQQAGAGGIQQTGLGLGFPGSVPGQDTVVEQKPGFFGQFVAPVLGAGAGLLTGGLLGGRGGGGAGDVTVSGFNPGLTAPTPAENTLLGQNPFLFGNR